MNGVATLLGVATVENLGALDAAPFTPEELTRIDEILA